MKKWQEKSKYKIAYCSCWMCGNPRKYLKGKDRLTLQELKEVERNILNSATSCDLSSDLSSQELWDLYESDLPRYQEMEDK